MSDDFDPNEFLNDSGSTNDGGQLRQRLEQVIKLNKELTAQVETLQSKDSERALADAWTKLEVPAAIQGLYNGEKTPQAVEAWWNESKSLFNLQIAETESQQIPTPEQQEHQQQLAAVSQASTMGHDVGFAGNDAFFKKAEEIKEMSAVNNPAAISDLFKLLGAPKGGLTVPHLQ